MTGTDEALPMRHTLATALCAMIPLAMPTSVRATEPAPMSIDDIHWPFVDAYCAFQREGQAFTFDDPETWRFVFLTAYPSERQGVFTRAFMRIGGELRELAQAGGSAEEKVIRYAVLSSPDIAVTLELVPGPEGYEATPYSGTVTVTRGEERQTAPFNGSCGV